MKKEQNAFLEVMKHAESYQEWSGAAKAFDQQSGNDEWKEEDASPHYDYKMTRSRYNELRACRKSGDVKQLVFFLNEGLHGNLGRIANPMLYQKSIFGTKQLITDYLNEVCACLRWIAETEFPNYSFVQKLEFFERTSQAFGKSALMLSGGAALALFHLGTLKAMFEEGLLPGIISGSSAGSIMVANLATHNDEELEPFFDPEYLYLEAFKAIGWRGTLKGQGLLDPAQLQFCIERNVKDMTFEEAFKHTGRKVNITVSPADTHQESRLLNALSSPHVLIRTATLASCAIPYIYPPVMLWAKNIDGEQCPFIPSRKWVDGSIKNDLPVERLARLYGVNHTIVSQTNPHAAPFISDKHKEKKIIDYLANMIVNNTRHNVSQVFDYLTNKVSNAQLALLLDKTNSMVTQSYVGDINIVPPGDAGNIFKVMTNATPAVLSKYIKQGSAATYPKIEFIRNCTMISKTITECLHQLKLAEKRELEKTEKKNPGQIY